MPNDILRAHLLQTLRRKPRRRLAVKRPPVWLYPTGVEKQYVGTLRHLVSLWLNLYRETVAGHIAGMIDEHTKLDAWPKDLSSLVSIMKHRFTEATAQLAHRITNTAVDVSTWNGKEWRKITEAAFGIQLLQDNRPLLLDLERFVENNISLISKLSDETAANIQRVISEGVAQGKSLREIQDAIEGTGVDRGIFDSVESRAELIARDQIGKLNGQLTMRRQTSIGVTRYVWRTALDERVRGNPSGLYPKAHPSHYDREGRIFRWDDPPEDGHPGEAINCRCYAEPVLTDIVEEADI